MKIIFDSIKFYRLPILSGLLVGVSYIPFPPLFVFVSYVPLMVFLADEERTFKHAFWGGWWTQLVLTLIGFHWVSYVATEFGGIPWYLSIFVLGSFASVIHLYIPIASWMSNLWWHRDRPDKSGFFAGMTLLFCFWEWIWPSIFPWHLGYVWVPYEVGIKDWADVVGFQGLSFATYFINGLVAWIWFHRRALGRVKLVFSTSMIAIILLTAHFTGLLHRQFISQQISSGQSEPGAIEKLEPPTDSMFKNTIRVGVIQASIGNLEKVYAEKGAGFMDSIANAHFQLTREALQKSGSLDLVVWPETAFPDYLDAHHMGRRLPTDLRNFVRSINTPLVTGAYSRDPYRKEYNAIFYFGREGNLLADPYRKSQLLMFGEFFPFSEYFPWIYKLMPYLASFGRGGGPEVWKSAPYAIGPQICYESLDPNFSRKLALQGARLLINVTNDSWFNAPGGFQFEAQQHMYMTLARAIENRIPMVRSTNTGISTVVQADGRILAFSKSFAAESNIYEIQLAREPIKPFFTRYGHLSPIVIIISLWIILVYWIGRSSFPRPVNMRPVKQPKTR